MHELINTSLPNGLIAGTHGFATAAMTRNLPDGLRVRLEQLSAYTHRTSVHDESYLRQNPVNWQHLILPKGEHVVSCILPAPFDYTGRTNRLAHHFCFTRDEFPRNGAATVIRLASDALTAAWTGEARWLVGDAALAARLAADAPADPATAAPHWEQLLGSGAGLEMAKRVAQFVCENLHTPGKSLAFRVDAETDADGRRLLGLFADVISLLPQQMRRDVTFSTYAAALPTGCPVCFVASTMIRQPSRWLPPSSPGWTAVRGGLSMRRSCQNILPLQPRVRCLLSPFLPSRSRN